MAYRIKQTNAEAWIHVAKGEGDQDTRDWPTETAANERAAKANADAEALGIKARYQVKEL